MKGAATKCSWMNLIATIVYWIIIVLWMAIFSTVVYFYAFNKRVFGTVRLLLVVLALDATRNIIENIYFGLYFGSKYGFFSPLYAHVLGNPHLLILPKLANIVAGCVVLSLLLLKWLPEAINERAEIDRQAKDLIELATVDGMTGLRTRTEFMSLAEAEWQRSRRYKRQLSLLILDIDHFKTINDNHGHGVGDDVIITIARLCRETKRAADVAGRLGGEEFAILLPETSIFDAQALAERLRNIISKETAAVTEGNIWATVSIGLSDAKHATSLAEIIKRADVALYAAKRAGRDRVCCFGEPYELLPG